MSDCEPEEGGSGLSIETVKDDVFGSKRQQRWVRNLMATYRSNTGSRTKTRR